MIKYITSFKNREDIFSISVPIFNDIYQLDCTQEIFDAYKECHGITPLQILHKMCTEFNQCCININHRGGVWLPEYSDLKLKMWIYKTYSDEDEKIPIFTVHVFSEDDNISWFGVL